MSNEYNSIKNNDSINFSPISTRENSVLLLELQIFSKAKEGKETPSAKSIGYYTCV